MRRANDLKGPSVSKTVDELIGVYIEASNAVVWEAEKRGLCPMTLDMQRAGIAAVVSELMEHFVTGASTYAWDADDLHAEFMKILGAAGDEAAAACATSQTEGEVHDGRISQSLSPTRRGRSEVAGPLEGSGSGATPDNQRGEEVARAVFGNHEAGRKRDVGGEGNNGLNEKVAGGSTREDEKAVEAAGDKGPVTVNSPATDPAPAVCEWREISVLDGIDHYSTKHGVKNRLHLYRKDDVCPVCLAPIKFTEAK